MSEVLNKIDVNDYGIQKMVGGGGGSQPNLQSKDISISTNGTTTVTPDQDYDGLSDVDVTVSGILDTSDANAVANNIESGKTAYVNGQKVTGELGVDTTFSTTVRYYNITINDLHKLEFKANNGFKRIFNNALIKLDADLADVAPVIGAIASKIKKDEVICGVTGTYEGANTPDWSQIGYSGPPSVVTEDYNYAKDVYDNWNSNLTDVSYKIADNFNLIFAPFINTTNAINMEGLFYNCVYLKEIPQLDTSNATNMSSMFYNCKALKSIPLLNTSNVTNMASMFSNCTNLKSIPQLDTSNVTIINGLFNSTYITNIPLLDFGKVTGLNDYTFKIGGQAEIVFGGFKDIGKAYVKTQTSNQIIHLEYINNIGHDSLMNIINNLYDLNLNEDLSVDGVCQYRQEIKIKAVNYNKLNASEIAIATNKGWDITSV